MPCPFFSWTSSTNHCCCYVYCSYKCSRALVHLILSVSKYFISLFNKISWLCGQQPGGDEASNEGWNSGPRGHDFTDNSNITRVFFLLFLFWVFFCRGQGEWGGHRDLMYTIRQLCRPRPVRSPVCLSGCAVCGQGCCVLSSRPYVCVSIFVRRSLELAELRVVVAASIFHFLSHLLSLPLLTLLLQRH